MIITMSVILLFTYPNLSLDSHGVITFIWDLQIFLCPMNKDVPHVHRATSLSTRTSDALMIFTMVHRHLEASGVEVTFGTIFPCVRSPPPDPRLAPAKDAKVCCGRHCKAKVRQDLRPRVSLGIEISVASSSHTQHLHKTNVSLLVIRCSVCSVNILNAH
jgi:hypothetical protein